MGSLCGNKGCHRSLWQHKNEIKHRLTLVQFFDLGINEECYWNYFHMALQFEDVFDGLSVKLLDFDYVILMDQSSGHGKKMDRGLNAIEMSMRYGGNIRNTTINELGNYPAKLNVGGTQSLSFISGDEGPFYLSAEEREGLKFDKFT